MLIEKSSNLANRSKRIVRGLCGQLTYTDVGPGSHFLPVAALMRGASSTENSVHDAVGPYEATVTRTFSRDASHTQSLRLYNWSVESRICLPFGSANDKLGHARNSLVLKDTSRTLHGT